MKYFLYNGIKLKINNTWKFGTNTLKENTLLNSVRNFFELKKGICEKFS
jgi:hypothetical protein